MSKIYKRPILAKALLVLFCMGFWYATLPNFCEALDMKEVVGGSSKKTCKSETACSGCNGNCTGSDDGTSCGQKSSTKKWHCGPLVENGGGCNLDDDSGKALGTDCECENESCVDQGGVGTNCENDIVLKCSVD